MHICVLWFVNLVSWCLQKLPKTQSFEPGHEISNNVVCAISKALLTEHHLEFLSLNGGRQARLSLHLSKCHIGNLMLRLILFPNENHIYQQNLPKDSDFDELLHLQAILTDKIKFNMS